ncbi:retrovirus-related pol polyprotein from transposon TNT 1-94 [Tanacetum coccineum]
MEETSLCGVAIGMVERSDRMGHPSVGKKCVKDRKDIYEIIDREYSPIPVPARRNISNQDELCKTKEFTVIRYSMGLDEEFIAVEPSKISTVERTPRSINYGVTCEDEAKRRNSLAKTKTIEENCYLLLYAISSKEDTAYQRQLITRLCVVHDTDLVESNSPEFDKLSKIKEEVIEIMAETMEKYMSKTRGEYGSGVARPKIDANAQFELKGQFLKELRDNTFSGLEHDDANEHIKKVLEIVDLFHIPNVTQDQVMLRSFPVSLTGAASCWLRNEPAGSITTWEVLKTKFLNKYYPPAHTTKKMEEINNFQQEPDESLFCA